MSVGKRTGAKCEDAFLHPQRLAHQGHPFSSELSPLLRPLPPGSAHILQADTNSVSTAFGLHGCPRQRLWVSDSIETLTINTTAVGSNDPTVAKANTAAPTEGPSGRKQGWLSSFKAGIPFA